VPKESTLRKLARRLGAEVAAELSRLVIAKAKRETRFRARAVRIDATVVEADGRYPSDAGLAQKAQPRLSASPADPGRPAAAAYAGEVARAEVDFADGSER